MRPQKRSRRSKSRRSKKIVLPRISSTPRGVIVWTRAKRVPLPITNLAESAFGPILCLPSPHWRASLSMWPAGERLASGFHQPPQPPGCALRSATTDFETPAPRAGVSISRAKKQRRFSVFRMLAFTASGRRFARSAPSRAQRTSATRVHVSSIFAPAAAGVIRRLCG